MRNSVIFEILGATAIAVLVLFLVVIVVNFLLTSVDSDDCSGPKFIDYADELEINGATLQVKIDKGWVQLSYYDEKNGDTIEERYKFKQYLVVKGCR